MRLFSACPRVQSLRRMQPARAAQAALLLFFLGLSLLWAAPALAHRINIFAWTEGPEVVVECAFNGSSQVKGGTVLVYDHVSGAELLRGNTDDKGLFRFAVPEAARVAGHALRIQADAGEGHQNHWLVEAAEFGAPAPAIKASAQAASPASVGSAPEAALPAAPAVPPLATSGSTVAELRQVVDAALDAKLAPIKRQLAEQRDAGPQMKDIVGGLGWLVGLAGMGLYFRGRRT